MAAAEAIIIPFYVAIPLNFHEIYVAF